MRNAAQPRHVLTVESVPASRSTLDAGPLAVMTFLSILQTKFKYLNTFNADRGRQGDGVFLEEINIEESIFGLPVRCAASWLQFIKPEEVIDNIIGLTGQFIDLGTDWKSWDNTVAKNIFSVRGSARAANAAPGAQVIVSPLLADPSQGDKIVDPCNASLPVFPAVENNDSSSRRTVKTPFKQAKPNKNNSYLLFKNWLETERNTPAGRLCYSQPPGNDQSAGYSDWDPTSDQGLQYPTSTGANDVIYYTGRSSYTVEYCGQAVRAGYEVPRPNLASLGAQGAVEQIGKFNQAQVATYFGVPVYAASWRIRYLIPGSPGNLQTPPPQTT